MLFRFANTFPKILCQVADDWILWNFNEFVGEIQQCLSSSQGSNREVFALAVFSDLLQEHTDYNSLVMTLISKRQYEEILKLAEHFRDAV